MDPQNTNPAPMQSPATPPSPPQQDGDKSAGPVIGTIIIILLIILGGLYFWGQRVNDRGAQTEDFVTPGADIESLETQGTSDDVTSIEADLNTTNLDDLGTEVDYIEGEAE